MNDSACYIHCAAMLRAFRVEDAESFLNRSTALNPRLAAEAQRLHQELQRTPTLDAQSRELLTALVQDINALLAAPAQQPAPRSADVVDKLEEAAVRFEVEHPTLSTTMRGVIDALGKAGV